jgi:hypothetical protein
MPYPHVTQFETRDLHRQMLLTPPQARRVTARTSTRPWRARLRRRASGQVTSA